MVRHIRTWLACIALLAATTPAHAQREVTLTFSQLGMDQQVDGGITALATDATNRLWVVAGRRVSAILGDTRATLFPLDANDDNLPAIDDYTSITFAELSDGENFFLGSTGGIAYGRVTANGEEYGNPLVRGDDQDQVNDLASDGSTTLWAATAGGLVQWDLTEGSPQWEETFLEDDPIQHVAVAPWGEALCTSGGRLYAVGTAGAAQVGGDINGTFLGLAFDGDGNLWTITDVQDAELRRFDTNSNATGLSGSSATFAFNVSLRTPVDLSIDPFARRVWVVGASDDGQRAEAYFQDLDVDGNLSANPDADTWQANASTQLDEVATVYADPSGNTWFGTDRGVTGLIVRLLNLDNSRYLGDGARAVAGLEDLPEFAGNGVTAETVSVRIQVGGTSADLSAVEDGDSGTFAFPFQFRLVTANPDFVAPNIFEVTSNSDGVPVSVAYQFTDANGLARELTAIASWANVRDFEDDLWIGGPCFLRILDH